MMVWRRHEWHQPLKATVVVTAVTLSLSPLPLLSAHNGSLVSHGQHGHDMG
jgi:hypothetical protein